MPLHTKNNSILELEKTSVSISYNLDDREYVLVYSFNKFYAASSICQALFKVLKRKHKTKTASSLYFNIGENVDFNKPFQITKSSRHFGGST